MRTAIEDDLLLDSMSHNLDRRTSLGAPQPFLSVSTRMQQLEQAMRERLRTTKNANEAMAQPVPRPLYSIFEQFDGFQNASTERGILTIFPLSELELFSLPVVQDQEEHDDDEDVEDEDGENQSMSASDMKVSNDATTATCLRISIGELWVQNASQRREIVLDLAPGPAGTFGQVLLEKGAASDDEEDENSEDAKRRKVSVLASSLLLFFEKFFPNDDDEDDDDEDGNEDDDGVDYGDEEDQ